jgi:arylsulfatase A-like enzyme
MTTPTSGDSAAPPPPPRGSLRRGAGHRVGSVAAIAALLGAAAFKIATAVGLVAGGVALLPVVLRGASGFVLDTVVAGALLGAGLVVARHTPARLAAPAGGSVFVVGLGAGLVGVVDVFFALAFGGPLTPAHRAWGHAADASLVARGPVVAAGVAGVVVAVGVVLAWRRPPSVRTLLVLLGVLLVVGTAGRVVDVVRDGGEARRQLGLDAQPLLALLPLPSVEADADTGPVVVDDPGPGPVDPAQVAPIRVDRGRRPRHVVLYVAESIAARFVDAQTMPRLMALQQQSLVFGDHVASSPVSIKALFSLLCGLHPLPTDELETAALPQVDCASLPGVLTRAGFDSALFHGGYFAFTDKLAFFGERGFSRLVDGENHPARASTWRNGWGIDDRAVVDEALRWLDTRPDPARPSLVVVVPLIPHYEYFLPPDAPTPFGTATVVARYKNALRFADDVYARLVDGYRERGIGEDTLFVFVGDHGEAFDEHPRNRLHGNFLYEENLRTPLVLTSPVLPPSLSRRPSTHADVTPTILDLVGVPPPAGAVVQGQSLVADSFRVRAMPLFTAVPTTRVGVRGARWKLVHDVEADRDELFDVRADPAEQRNRVADEPLVAAKLRAQAKTWQREQPPLLRALVRGASWLERMARANDLPTRVVRVFNMERTCVPIAAVPDVDVVVELRGLDPPARIVGVGIDDRSRRARRGPLDVTVETDGAVVPLHVDARFETSSTVVDIPPSKTVRVRVARSSGVTGCVWLAP